MRSIFSLVLALVLLVVIILDGSAMYGAYRSSQDVALGAAQQAALAYVASNGNEGAALGKANAFVENEGGELLTLDFHQAQTKWYEARVRVEAKTFFFKFVPGLNRYLAQESTAVVRF
ncbi:MAG: hypothetical protein Kow00122_06480 [Thermoleophilia bacterium]